VKGANFVMKLLIAALVAIVVVAPANANTLSSVTLGPVTQNFTGACPATITFTATIKGSPGSVSYQFFGNGGAPDGAQQSTTIPGTGSVTVSETPAVDAAHQGSFNRQVLAKAGNLAYSNQVNYTVKCASTPTPLPTTVPIIAGPPVPTGLINTTDPAQCGAHGGWAGLICPGALHDHWLVLIFNWQGDANYSAVDGFRTYEVDNGKHVKVNESSAGGQGTMSFVKPPAGGFDGKCYALTSYAGGIESQDSKPFCIGSGSTGTKLLTLQQSRWAWRYQDYIHNLGGGYGLRCNDLCLGWIHYRSSGIVFDHENTYWRSAVLFDPARINGLKVFSAHLLLRVVGGSAGCFGALGTANSDWWDNSNMIDADFQSGIPGELDSTGADFDVTDIVKQWAQGAPNFGFAFSGKDEDQGADDNARCMLDFATNPALQIEHF